jgi:hypothetical protein
MTIRMRWKNLIAPRPDAPFPAWMIFPVVFAALYVSHISLLRLPYYWDEAGYYIPAAWDFFRTGSLIPITTLSNAHPPLPSLYLALWWKAAGFYPEVTREAVLLVATLGLVAVWRLALRLTGSGSVAFWTVLLTAIYPVWFAQSTLAHADIFAAACTLWGLVYVLPDRDPKPWAALGWFMAAALAKETAIAVPLTLSLVNAVEGMLDREERWRLWRMSGLLALSTIPLAVWYAWHAEKTGFIFGNPEFLRYNAEATVTPVRVLAAFGHRILHLTAHMNMFVPTLLTAAALMLKPRIDAEGRAREGLSRRVLRRIFWVLLANALMLSVLGGALLTRYLLALYPLVLLVEVATFYRRVPLWQGLTLLSAMAFTVGLFINPPYRFAPEDNLAYARVIRLHRAGIAELAQHYRGTAVLSAWPVTDELTKPELGYVKQPYAVDRIDDFTAGQIDRVASAPQKDAAALVFSTKYDPPAILLSLGPKSEKLDERYFGLHHDLAPEAIAKRLDGTVVWESEDHGMWIALIGLNRAGATR